MGTIKINQSGQGLTEYIILLLLISIVSISFVRGLGSTVTSKLDAARRNINEHVTVDGN